MPTITHVSSRLYAGSDAAGRKLVSLLNSHMGCHFSADMAGLLGTMIARETGAPELITALHSCIIDLASVVECLPGTYRDHLLEARIERYRATLSKVVGDEPTSCDEDKPSVEEMVLNTAQRDADIEEGIDRE